MRVPKMFVVWYFWKDYRDLIDVSPFNILFSAGHYWDGKKFAVPKLLRFEELFIDSGGFQLVGHYEDYPFSIEDYMNYALSLNPDYIATLDYPCDERLRGKMTNKERIEKTVDNAAVILDNFDLDSTIVPVLQGYTLDEFQYCIDLYKSRGLVQPLMGVGSVCSRRKKDEVKDILDLIYKQTNCKLHVFGINLSFLKDGNIRKKVYSFDTFAWWFVSHFGKACVFSGERRLELHSRQKLTDVERLFLSLRATLDYYDYLSKTWHSHQYNKFGDGGVKCE